MGVGHDDRGRVSTDAQASWWGGRGVGTVPHALIAAYGGDTALAARKFAERFKRDMNVTVLVDFVNDSVRTALEVAAALGEDLWGVRLDTSDQLADEGLRRAYGDAAGKGVTADLVRLVRTELDAAGFGGVRIVVSGGFTAERIARFEAEGVPVDSYGVGSSLIRESNDFTADRDGRRWPVHEGRARVPPQPLPRSDPLNPPAGSPTWADPQRLRFLLDRIST